MILYCGELMGQINPNNYDMTCYCSGRETPQWVISRDNNLQLTMLFSNGLSKKGLDSLHIPYTDSQLKLLKIYNLIRQENNKYYSNIPILDENQTNQLRIQSKQIADKIIPLIEKDIKDIVSYLNSIGRSQNAFSITFSYVLDGLIWKEFEEKKIIRPLDSKDNISPWTGYFWILASQRNLKYGTNTETDSSVTISITNGAPYKLMKSFYDDDLLKLLLKNIRLSGKVTDTRVMEAYGKNNIFDEQGKVTIPIIDENNQDKLYQLSKQISIKICDNTISNISFNEIIKKYNFKDKEQAIIILYHEIMWDLLANIEQKNIIVKPLIIKEPNKAEMKDAADLILIIRNN